MKIKMIGEKGITPVVATVLLLMMTVSAAAAAYYWMTTVQSDLQNKVAQNIQSTVGTTAALKIDASSCSTSQVTVYLRNPTDTKITDLKIFVYTMDGSLQGEATSLSQDYVNGDSTATVTGSISLTSGESYNIKVVGSPNVEATSTCKVP